MDTMMMLALAASTAAVSFVAAWKIRRRLVAALTAASCSVGIPIVAAILFTSLFPWSPLGPEELLQRAWEIFIGRGAVHLPWTAAAWLAGLVLGTVAGWGIIHRRSNSR